MMQIIYNNMIISAKARCLMITKIAMCRKNALNAPVGGNFLPAVNVNTLMFRLMVQTSWSVTMCQSVQVELILLLSARMAK